MVSEWYWEKSIYVGLECNSLVANRKWEGEVWQPVLLVIGGGAVCLLLGTAFFEWGVWSSLIGNGFDGSQ
jgi:hypothetical protein